ncbi:GNAT family N-acetyltransferase [Lihuaxuella thermophila]|uniref:Phosphinothricin acetyltransferase n=1 Tax=Lihuaxuella thermophila TaxID=1173111 RepID=A0A1H8ITZ0_9BACL|nr:GNAT family N-acetyltransferase [Lihuaxuella thermophila]SEN71922.1 phosphinothricin acetyltransferase [Lihuaxuella thermophila]
MVTVREAQLEDLPAILRIYNHAVLTSTATFDLEEQTLEQRKTWFSHYGGKYPLIVAEENGQVTGYCCLSPFRSKPAYEKTAEVSIYIDPDHFGKGIGTILMTEILKRAGELDYHVIIAGITGGNEASVRLHRKFGFQLAGIFKEVGFKFGEWQDVHFYQLILREPGQA